MTSRISIRVLAPMLLLLPVVVVSAIILLISSISAKQAAVQQAESELARIQLAVADRVDSVLATPMRVTQFNSELLEAGTLDSADAGAWRETLLSQAKAFPSLSAITWGTEDKTATWIAQYGRGDTKLYYALLARGDGGTMREYLVDEDGSVAERPTSEFAFDPTGRPWYTSAAAAGGPVWSEPYAWAGDASAGTVTMGLSYSRPYPGGDEPRIGVLSADLNLDDLSTFLAAMKIGESGHCYVVDEQGRLVATSIKMTLFDEQGKLKRAADVEDPSIGTLARFWASPDRQGEKLAEIEVTGEQVITMRSGIGEQAGLEWTLVTVVPEADFMAEARQTWFRTLLVGVGVVILTLLGGLLLSRWLSRPVVALEEHVEKVGEGDLDRRIELSESAEFARLSAAMNKMSLDLKEHFELRRSLAMAMEVQQSLLPDRLPKVQGMQIAGNSMYCDQTGGDYYDFLELSGLSDHSVAVVVGDVMGHGIAAAMLMATARGILRSRSTEPGSLGDLTGHLNEQLAEVTQGKRFMTMIMASIDSQTRELRWSSAGHDAPFIFNPQTNEFVELDGGGLPLGVMAQESYEEEVLDDLASGTIIAFVTDGVFEARSLEESMYGKERIMELIRENHDATAAEIAKVLENDLDVFQTGTSAEDDITYVIVKLV